IASRGLDIYVVEQFGLEQCAVGRAIERNTAGHCQPPQIGFADQMSANMLHGIPQALLQCSGDVSMGALNLSLWRPRLDQMLCEVGPGGEIPLTVSIGLVKSQYRN